MKLPALTGIVRRRLLLNYRVDPAVVARLVPGNFRVLQVGGCAIAGICLIRLEQIRPIGLPAILGVASENGAHRISVEWDTPGGVQQGVYIPRRDTGSRLNSLVGGRLFPGVHHLSRFRVTDRDGALSVCVTAEDLRQPLVELEAMETAQFSPSSVFANLEESSKFFLAGCVGYSARPDSCVLDGVTLKTQRWKVAPLQVRSIKSAYYDNRALFPAGSIEFDHALIMRDIPHQWLSEPDMRAQEPVEVVGV